jgi:predicted membrane protein
MGIDIENQNQKTPGNGKMLVGLLLLILGIGFLFQQLNFFFIPHWLFSPASWLIIWGLYSGAKCNFRNAFWLIMVLVGAAWLLSDIFPNYNIHNIVWPIALITFGIWLITKRKSTLDQNNWGRKWDEKWSRKTSGYGNPFEPVITPVTPVDAPPAEPEASTTSSTNIPPSSGFQNYGPIKGDDFIDAVSIFGGVKKTILSKNFRGGEIVNVFGGAELDFTQADIQGRVVIDITQIFGGTKIIVPSNWQVVSDLAAVFASVDDKRINRGILDNDKVLVLKGVSIFAGVDVRSY